MWWLACFALLLVPSGCGPVRQPESLKTIAAFEIPLRSAGERAEFLRLLEAEARVEGFHVDAASDQELKQLAGAIPLAAMSIHAAVWRGDDEGVEASVMDMGHPGFAWISFAQGEEPGRSTRFRDRMVRRMYARWPTTLPVPITPGGAMPLRDDLRRVPGGYKVDPTAAPRYDLPPSSPLILGN